MEFLDLQVFIITSCEQMPNFFVYILRLQLPLTTLSLVESIVITMA
jgi:hypothetical protein